MAPEQLAHRQVIAPLAPLRREPHSAAALDTEALIGERVEAAGDDGEGWVRVTLLSDGYAGYLPASALGEPVEATHRVVVPRTFVYPGRSIKLPPLAVLPLTGRVSALAAEEQFARIRGDFGEGFVYGAHLAPVAAAWESDFVTVAERFLGVPYLWGGKSALGIDCSALVQLSLAAAGVSAPRDSGPQSRELGEPLPDGETPQRGDLAFWPGHVGILRDADTLLHASGHHMLVVSEPLAEAMARIRRDTGHDAAFRRRAAQ
ncbi:NlpC/P60 family protein [Pseudochelatococcus sp. B33]